MCILSCFVFLGLCICFVCFVFLLLCLFITLAIISNDDWLPLKEPSNLFPPLSTVSPFIAESTNKVYYRKNSFRSYLNSSDNDDRGVIWGTYESWREIWYIINRIDCKENLTQIPKNEVKNFKVNGHRFVWKYGINGFLSRSTV